MLLKAKSRDDKYIDAESIIGGKNGILRNNGKKYEISIQGESECSKACPAGINVKTYINLIANRKFEEAVDVIRQANPFPAICGRVCTRPCETNCEHGKKGDPVSIRALKRFASDYELVRRPVTIEPCNIIYKEKIAVIGAGPAGLTAAVDLVNLGYPVTVFEAEKEAGGMLRYGIPTYRLPNRVLKREIDWIKGLGIKIKTGKHIDDPGTLLKNGFSAVLIAQGCQYAFILEVDGKKADGIIDPLKFLNEVNTGQRKKIMGIVIVIGGGSTAFDVARSAIRLGAKKVILSYRRGLEEMPAEHEEIQDALKEGVNIKILTIPKRIIIKNDKVVGIEFYHAELGTPDASGRRRPHPIENSEFTMKADVIIPAIGTRAQSISVDGENVLNNLGRVTINECNQTSVQGVFAAGDVETGPSSVVEAISRGHVAAKSIVAYLKGDKPVDSDFNESRIPIVIEEPVYSRVKYFPKSLENKDRVSSFNEIRSSFSDFEAVQEASRCFTCGPCQICQVCFPNCTYKQLVANIDDTEFLLKVPSVLSLDITYKGPSTYKLESNRKIKPIYLQSLTAKIDTNLCLNCGRCEEVCAYRAISDEISKDKGVVTKINHDACASCSACVSTCPSGAISQGFMSDNELLLRLKKKKTPYEGVKALMNYWSTPSLSFGNYDGVVELMSERKPSPCFLIRALARSGKGLLIIGPDEKTRSHYMPWDENHLEIIKKTKGLLTLVGISPYRIQYRGVPNETNPSRILKEFSQFLDKKNLGNLEVYIPDTISCPIGESITILRIMGANPDIKASDAFFSVSSVKAGGTAFFEGCLPMLHMVGVSHKLYDFGPTRKAIHQLLKYININYGKIEGFTCPSKGLLHSKIKNKNAIVGKIAEKNLKSFKKANPKRLILGTPESYNSFLNDKDYRNIVSLPDELLNSINKLGKLSPIKKTIAIHQACLMEKDPFYDATKKILNLIPGLKIVEIKKKCGHSGFDILNAKSKESAINLLKEAANKDVDMIVCTSPYCESHLLLNQREGSWRTIDIKITDSYNLLISSFKGVNI